MAENELQTVLENWIAQANSPIGKLPSGVEPIQWIAEQFGQWWKMRVGEELANTHSAADRLRIELTRVASTRDLDEALHELTHLQDALSDLEQAIGFHLGPRP